MTIKGQFREYRVFIGRFVLFLFLTAAMACSRPLGMPTESEVGETNPHQAPFHEDSNKLVSHPAEDAVLSSSGEEDQLPFRDRENLPAGTMISVRLNDPISVGDSDASHTFAGIVLDPVVVEGSTLIPSGAAVAGLVESAQTSKVKANRGYVRLSLATCRIEGVEVPVRTASLFVRQFPITDTSASIVYLERGRRLTFRLTKPVYLAGQRTQSRH